MYMCMCIFYLSYVELAVSASRSSPIYATASTALRRISWKGPALNSPEYIYIYVSLSLCMRACSHVQAGTRAQRPMTNIQQSNSNRRQQSMQGCRV